MTYTIEIAGRLFDGTENADGNIWLADGLTGWFDGANSRATFEDIPGQHGGFEPSQVLLGARHMEFNGAVLTESDELSEAIARQWLAVLSATDGFDVTVTDALGVLTSRCWVEGKPVGKRLGEGKFTFSLPLVAPDPIRYGPERVVQKSAEHVVTGGLVYPLTYPLEYGDLSAGLLSGYLQITNAGKAPVYPSFRVGGQVTGGFTLVSDAYTVKFTRDLAAGEEVFFGPAYGGRAVLADGSDVSTFLTLAQWVAVPGEGQRGFMITPIGSASNGAFVEATIRDGWF